MKKSLLALIMVVLIASSFFGGYWYGWWKGFWYEAVASQIANGGFGIALRKYMNEKKYSEALAFINKYMIEQNITTLTLSEKQIPKKFKSNYENLKKADERTRN